ncbi:unnamed protein product [Effrenium voratum]|nr:unnamed protein product [Effrenium voratum]
MKARTVWGVYLYTRLPHSAGAGLRSEKSSELPPERLGLTEGLANAVGDKPDYPKHCQVQQLFEKQVALSPNANALHLPDLLQTVTYAELQEAVQGLTTTLLGLGIGPRQIVALCLPRSAAQVVSVFASLSAGAGYLPIDAAAPEARKQYLLEDSHAQVLISEEEQVECQQLAELRCIGWVGMSPLKVGKFRVQQPKLSSPTVDKEVFGSDVAMLIYTSGSTGEPKGIVYDHTHLLHGAWFWAQEHAMNADSVQLFKSPYFWAVMEWEIFPALIVGGSLVVASREGHKSPEYMARIIQKFNVDVLMITPSVLDLLLDVHEVQGAPLERLKHITTVGEPLPTALANRAVRTRNLTATLRNFYGASESSCTVYRVPSCGLDPSLPRCPAGLPQPHASVFIMANEPGFRVVGPGESGEICFGGVLAASYWRRKELTEAKFVQTAAFGRLYCTGDLGCFSNGMLEVIGRLDRQLKINGVRVEPGEIEAVLQRFQSTKDDEEQQVLDCVAQAAVVASEKTSQLVAFVVPKGGQIDSAELMEHCRRELMPAYLPKTISVVPDGLPVLPNGKVDYPSLKKMADEQVLEAQETVMDSLGQMRSMSRWAVLENAVIHRCYAFWMLGVLLDHYSWCAMSTDPEDPTKMASLPFCSAFASQRVQPWSESLIRSIGNDQDLFGFIMLGAYQDSRPERNKTRKKAQLLGIDFYLLGIYFFMALPWPHLCYWFTGGWAYPDRTWQTVPEAVASNKWDLAYLQNCSILAGHRWYLLMIFASKLYLACCEFFRVQPRYQVALAAFCSYLGPVYGAEVCELSGNVHFAQFLLVWLFDGCYAWYRWVAWYGTFYVFSFHYLRPIVKWISQRAPQGPVWAAAATACSMIMGMSMALFHYPNQLLESGQDGSMQLLELFVTFAQPALFALGTVYWPINASWWGNTTLGCYVCHFVFRDRMTEAIQFLVSLLSWDSSGLLLPLAAMCLCLCFTTTVGPLGHYILISPQLLLSRRKARDLHQKP